MANSLYETARAAFAKAEINWLTDTIKLVVVDSADYTLNLTTDDFLNDIPVAGRVATSAAFTSKTVSATGQVDAADVTLTAVTGDQFELIVIYKDTGVESTSQLIAAIDTATGLPFTPTGSNITIQWGAFIFRLGP